MENNYKINWFEIAQKLTVEKGKLELELYAMAQTIQEMERELDDRSIPEEKDVK
ncbi:hypothetical protein MUA48_07870 [Staphylococcus sp. IVB6238]|uniref:hypothetical protein n=1 Tax=Staphylococcus sp. IVB6238 TaxID=2989770 RepID=UPI0021CFF741|nr:hypothetical protein [Staphylococcus sp. IVB6238]UXR73290.1 hypothetical protein MUA48_07870 [Staphylococcus sp. IVB6238]